MAPELLADDGQSENAGKPSKASDIYAAAMVFWQASLKL